MAWTKSVVRFCVVTLTFFLAGCGRPTTCVVSGTVTFDGAPIPAGYIAFVPENAGRGGGGAIAGGQYKVLAQPGKARVEITANKKMSLPAGKKTIEGATETNVQYLPERYNAKTELTANVSAGTNTFDFDLTGNK